MNVKKKQQRQPCPSFDMLNGPYTPIPPCLGPLAVETEGMDINETACHTHQSSARYSFGLNIIGQQAV